MLPLLIQHILYMYSNTRIASTLARRVGLASQNIHDKRTGFDQPPRLLELRHANPPVSARADLAVARFA